MNHLARRAVAEKPTETQDKPHFQRHSCPGPVFLAGNALFALFSQNFLLEVIKMPLLAIYKCCLLPEVDPLYIDDLRFTVEADPDSEIPEKSLAEKK
jgi:hypothetical protein